MLDAVSILLPVYNWPIGALLTALHQQAAAEPGLRFEILAFDDASPDLAQRAANRAAVTGLPYVRYHELPLNAGRAAIRNQLAAAARYPWLLFLDADSDLPDDRFLRRYRQAVAVMTLPNEPSLALHRALGFESVGTLRRVGWKHGAWHDVVWAQRELAPGDEGPPSELGLPVPGD